MIRACAVLVLTVAAHAQTPTAELTEPERQELGVKLVAGEAGEFREIEWGKVRIPLKTAAKACAVGRAPAGKDLVILAGGVHDTLDLYMVEPSGAFHRHATGGGRRLPRKWNGGQGSWPVLEGRDLVFFAYEKESGIEFRVLDFAGRVLASRRLPLSVEGWSISSEPDAGRVTVRFGDDVPAVVFRHPRSARLELSTGLIRFGDIQVGRRGRQLLYLTNSGARPLRLRAVLDHPAFELDGKVPETLGPGARARVLVHFAPKSAGTTEARLKFVTTGAVPEHLVVLRGRGVAVTEVGAPVTPGVTPKPNVAAPMVRTAHLYPVGGGYVLVLGESSGSGRFMLRGPGGRTVTIDSDRVGRFHARLEVAPGGMLEVAAVAADGRASAFVRLATAPKMLEVDAKQITVRTRPGHVFRISIRAGGDVIRRMTGRTGESGVKRIPLAVLGEGPSPALQLVVSVEDEGQWRSSPAVDVPARK